MTPSSGAVSAQAPPPPRSRTGGATSLQRQQMSVLRQRVSSLQKQVRLQ